MLLSENALLRPARPHRDSFARSIDHQLVSHRLAPSTQLTRLSRKSGRPMTSKASTSKLRVMFGGFGESALL
jgi:hypothetical protein